MDMQREDFINLWKLPELTLEVSNPYLKTTVRTRDGWGRCNVGRIITDWFPLGSIVKLCGATYISRGAQRSAREFGWPELHLVDPSSMGVHKFSVLEALAIAEISNQEEAK